MPIQHASGKVGAKPVSLTVSKLATEKLREDMIVECPSMVSNWYKSRLLEELAGWPSLRNWPLGAPDLSRLVVKIVMNRDPQKDTKNYTTFRENGPNATLVHHS